MDDYDLDFIVKKVLSLPGLLNIYNVCREHTYGWYESTGIRCQDLEILNESLELALDRYKKEKMAKGMMRQMKIGNDLISIIEKTPISLRELIRHYDKTGMRLLRGITERIPYRKVGMGAIVDKLGWSEYIIELSYHLDNMGETLVHEVLHIKYPSLTEGEINEFTEIYWNKYPTVRKAAVRRLVYELGKKDL